MGQRRERIIKPLAQAIPYPSIAMLSRIDNVKTPSIVSITALPSISISISTPSPPISDPPRLTTSAQPATPHTRTHANNALPTIHPRPPLHRHLGTSENPHAPASHIRYEEPSRFGTRVHERPDARCTRERADRTSARARRQPHAHLLARLSDLSSHFPFQARAGLLRGACRLG